MLAAPGAIGKEISLFEIGVTSVLREWNLIKPPYLQVVVLG